MTFFPNRQRIVLERHQLGLTLVHISKTNFYQKMVKEHICIYPGGLEKRTSLGNAELKRAVAHVQKHFYPLVKCCQIFLEVCREYLQKVTRLPLFWCPTDTQVFGLITVINLRVSI